MFPATSSFLMKCISLASTERAKPHEKSAQEHKSKGFLGLLFQHESKTLMKSFFRKRLSFAGLESWWRADYSSPTLLSLGQSREVSDVVSCCYHFSSIVPAYEHARVQPLLRLKKAPNTYSVFFNGDWDIRSRNWKTCGLKLTKNLNIMSLVLCKNPLHILDYSPGQVFKVSLTACEDKCALGWLLSQGQTPSNYTLRKIK